MAGLAHLPATVASGGSSLLVYSSPSAPTARARLRFDLSTDGGTSWRSGPVLWPQLAGYSDLVQGQGGTAVGVLFENGEQTFSDRISFASVSKAWLLQNGGLSTTLKTEDDQGIHVAEQQLASSSPSSLINLPPPSTGGTGAEEAPARPSPPPPALPARCTTDFSCSFNGVCDTGSCSCSAAWRGRFCETLAVEAGPRKLGYQPHEGGSRLAAWGGAALRDDAGLYHLIASEMVGHAGLVAWGCNSRVIHATSTDPLTQPFVKRRVLWDVFSHEPRCTRAPATKEFVCFFSHNPAYPSPPCTGSAGNTDPESCRCNNGGDKPTYMSFTTDLLAGNWSAPVLVVPSKVDLNLSPFIFPNQSLHALCKSARVGLHQN